MKLSPWAEEYCAILFAGDLLEAMIEVSKMPPPKPKENPKPVDPQKKS